MSLFDDLIAASEPWLIVRTCHRQQGASWEIRQPLRTSTNGTTWTGMDWTGCTATCQIRKTTGDLVFSFTSLSLTTGYLTMTATPSQTANLAVGRHRYDVDIVNAAGRRLPFMSGTFVIEKQVTT